MLTETWLTNGVLNSELFPDCYMVYRSDRDFVRANRSKGGGVLLALKSSFHAEAIDLKLFECLPLIDITGCRLFINNKFIYVFVVYIPPDLSTAHYELFLDLFLELNVLCHDVIMIGDFNMAKFITKDSWDTKCYLFQNFLSFSDLSQCNDVINSNNTLLDLVCTNLSKCIVTHDSVTLVGEDLHHPALSVDIELKCSVSKPFPVHSQHTRYNFKRANFQGLYSALCGVDWSFLRMYTDVNAACNAFYTKLYNLLDNYVPKHKYRQRKYPPWFSKEVKDNIKTKNYYLRRYRLTKDPYHYQQFQTLRRLVKTRIKSDYVQYIKRTENNLKSNPKEFWSFAKSIKGFSPVPPSVNYNNVIHTKPQDVVDAFSDYFSSIYKESPFSVNCVNLESLSNNNCLWPDIRINLISSETILESINKIKSANTAGNDEIPMFLVKDCRHIIVEPLSIIYNLSLKTCVFPNIWKKAKTCPIFKSGEKSLVLNYRPIAILNNFSKIFEGAVHNLMYSKIKNVINVHQHGFIKGRSTMTNLSCASQIIAETIDANGQLDVIYTDITKAFDKLDHKILLDKMQHYGLSDDLRQWFLSYLSHREQVITINGYCSKPFYPTSGVPQGSNLGPLLFSIYINDVTKVISNSKVLLYADDLKLLKRIENLSDHLALQADVVSFQNWCIKNKLELNVKKCKVVTYTKRRTFEPFLYRINDCTISRDTKIKDLGVWFDQELSFAEHINTIISSSSKMLGFIIRNTKDFSNIDTLKTLYYALVRSKLEYCVLVWLPFYNHYKIALEKIQRKFLKQLHYRVVGTFPQHRIDQESLLSRFNLVSLEYRRYCLCLTFLYNLVNNVSDCPELLNKICLHVPRLNARQSEYYSNAICRTNVGKRAPVHTLTSYYNKIAHLCDINVCTKNQLLQHIEQAIIV